VGKLRARNEDSVAICPEDGLIVVADGMGGLPAGDLASRMAAETVTRVLGGPVSAPEAAPWEVMAEDLRRRMWAAVREANRAVLHEASRTAERTGMGTTLTALQIAPTSGLFVIGHVGDSRAYYLSGDAFSQLTKDQTWVQSQVDAGALDPHLARDHPYGHVLVQVVGMEGDLEPQIIQGQAQPGDVFLLCTDGLTRVIEESEIQAALTESRSSGLDWATSALVAEANIRGAPDNVTVAILRLVP
jgi:protein phosphatase